MTNNARASIDKEHQKNQSYVEIGFDGSFEKSDSRHISAPISAKIAVPQWNGHLLLRADIVSSTDKNLDVFDSTENIDSTDTGMNLAVGWEAESWRADIGRTPLGFEFQHWVGGLRFDSEISDYSFSIDLSRRAETGSTTSYAGSSETIFGRQQQWGGVLKTGASLGLSWNIGESIGVWSGAEWHQFKGHNVKDNQRLALMAGSYYKVLDEQQQRLNVGLSLFNMGYDNNQNVVAPGFGDYYSPQSYLSVAMPVSYHALVSEQWSVGLLGSLSHSWSTIEAPINTLGATEKSSGLAFALEAVTEYKLSTHWSVGGYLGIQVASDYQPNQIKAYLRYYFDENWFAADLTPVPITLYSEF